MVGEAKTLPSRKPSTRTKQAQEANTTEDFMFRITGHRPVGGLVVFRSKLWWGLLLDEPKRKRGKKHEGSASRYWVRMIAAGWLDSERAEPPRKKERCIACARGRASLWCMQCKSFLHAQRIPGFDFKDAKVIWCPWCLAEWDTEEQSQMDTCTLCSTERPGGSSAWHVMSSCSPAIRGYRHSGSVWLAHSGRWSRQP